MRPQGDPLPRFLALPASEDVAALFGQWDRAGRIPAGSLLALHTGTAWGLFGGSGYQLVAGSAGDTPPGRDVPPAVLDPLAVRCTIRQRGNSDRVIFSPMEARRS